MKTSKYSDSLIMSILKQAEAGTPSTQLMPRTWHEFCHFLQVEVQIWRHGSFHDDST